MALDYTSLLFDSAIVSNGSNDDLFTLSSGESVDNLTIRFTNYTGTAATATAWCQDSAGAEDPGDRFLNSYSVAANSFVDIEVPRMVGGGNAAKLTVTAGTATALVVSQISGIKRT